MARIEGTGPKGLYQRFVFWLARRMLGREPGSMRIWARHPATFKGACEMERAMQASKLLPKRIHLLADIAAARIVGCAYCLDIGAWIGRSEAGLTTEELRALDRYRTAPCFTDAERLAIEYAEAMSHTPVRVTDALFDRLRTHFSDAQLVELTAVVAWEQYRTRFNHAVGLQPDGFSEGQYCPVPAAPPTVDPAADPAADPAGSAA